MTSILLLNVEQVHRSLYPVRRLREEYGLSIEVAMQCDVNGIAGSSPTSCRRLAWTF